MIDLLHEISQTLSHNKLRLALTGFAVAWGIFMLLVLLALAGGLINSFEHNMLSRDSNIINLWGGRTTRAWHGLKDGREIDLKETDLQAITTAGNRDLLEASASVDNDTATFATATDFISGGYKAVFPAYASQAGAMMTAGRFINDRDMALRRKVVVLHSSSATTLFGSDSAAVGKRLKAMGLSWTVVGVYNHRWQQGSYVPYSTATALTGSDGTVDQIDVQITPVTSAAQGHEIDSAVQTIMARQHNFDPADESAVWINNRATGQIEARGAMNILMITMWVIGAFTLLSGIVGVSNIMFVSVRERTHEIGIRRAIGAHRSDILRQVVVESVAITLIFGYIGIVAATAVTTLISHLIGNSLEMLRNPTVNLTIAIEVTVVLIIAGALAGLFPALKATKVKPVEALRDE